MEIGSLTDWIIALANVVMAGAAAYAAVSAKNWLATKTNDYAIKHLVEYHQLLVKLKNDLDSLSILLDRKYSNDNQDEIEKITHIIIEKHSELRDIKDYANAFSCEINDGDILSDIQYIESHSHSFLGESFRKSMNSTSTDGTRKSIIKHIAYSKLNNAEGIKAEVLSRILQLSKKIKSLRINEMLTK